MKRGKYVGVVSSNLRLCARAKKNFIPPKLKDGIVSIFCACQNPLSTCTVVALCVHCGCTVAALWLHSVCTVGALWIREGISIASRIFQSGRNMLTFSVYFMTIKTFSCIL